MTQSIVFPFRAEALQLLTNHEDFTLKQAQFLGQATVLNVLSAKQEKWLHGMLIRRGYAGLKTGA